MDTKRRIVEEQEQSGHSNPPKRRRSEYDKWPSWSPEQVCNFLKDHLKDDFTEDFVRAFKEEDISGVCLPQITEDVLEKMNIKKIGVRLRVLQVIKDQLHVKQTCPPFSQIHDMFKVFNDPVHGHLEMHPLCVRIIDTPQFQRLRQIKQLGGCYLVFPGASHNRFEHSLGVACLAGEYLGVIRKRQPQLDITDADLLCVRIAGLCHDLGRGPFSNVFHDMFLPKARPDRKLKCEEASVNMFRHILEENNLMDAFKEYGLSETDVTFIEELIRGSDTHHREQTWPCKGRGKEKGFLYEIVHNKWNGVDVNRWDYLARDCHHLGMRNNFDHKRFMKFAQVKKADGHWQICSRDKEAWDLYDMFYAGVMLNRKAYKHKTTKIIEHMITEALLKADDVIKIQGDNGERKISESIDDMVAYTKLDDSVFQTILHSPSPELAEARRILDMVQRRQLYKFVGQTQPSPDFEITNLKEMAEDMVKHCDVSEEDDTQTILRPEDLVLELVQMDFGMGDKNPVDNVRFYLKWDPEKIVKFNKEQVSQMLPRQFTDKHLRVYCRKRDLESFHLAREGFFKWCRLNPNFTKPQGGDMLIDMTSSQQSDERSTFTTLQRAGSANPADATVVIE